MKAITDQLGRVPDIRKNYQELVQDVLSDQEVANFVKQYNLNEVEIQRSISKFFEYINARHQFESGDQSYASKGYKPILIKNEGYADVSYQPTADLENQRNKVNVRRRIKLINLPEKFKEARLENFDVATELRLKLANYITNLANNGLKSVKKGLYLYGDFGTGKTYIMATLARELSEKGFESTLIHYPSFVVDIKNAINDGTVKEKIDEIKTSELLILDDIGAEQHSSWVRDDVLQVILQYRMDRDKPTFFTSNFNFKDLEGHFANGRKGDETWQARRLMERIRYLAEEVHLEGRNRR